MSSSGRRSAAARAPRCSRGTPPPIVPRSWSATSAGPASRTRPRPQAQGFTMTKLLQHEVFAPSKEREGEIAALGPWFHNLHLPDGSETAPHHRLGNFPAFKWAEIAPHIPSDLTGWRVLDIGCNAGFYSFELAKRGAHVTG